MLLQLLYEQVERDPGRDAVVYGEERLSFADLVERIERLASGFADCGIGPGDAVGLVLTDDPWFVVAFHAVAALGAKAVPANPAFKQAELEFWFKSTNVVAIVSDEKTAGVCERIAAGFERPVRVIGSGPGHGQSTTLGRLVESGTAVRLGPRAADEPAVGQFSSGSTGRPKRLDRTHGQFIAEAEGYRSLGLEATDRILAAVPFSSSWGMGSAILASAASGATLVILEAPHPFLLRRHRALELIEQEGVTVFPGVPFHYRLLANSPGGGDLSTLRFCFSAGTALPRETFEAFGERFGVLVRQLYGSTETGLIAANMTEDPVATFESVGRPVGGVGVRIVDEGGGERPVGEVGEIAVTSPAATDGYSEMPELNRAAFQDGYFLTGDLGRFDDDGMLYLVGRKKLLIDTSGFKVDPIEVESVINGHPAVAEAVVVGIDAGATGEQVVKAVVVCEGSCEERELIAYCRERLANFKVPKSVEFRDELPRSPLGKVLRKYLV